MLPSCYIALAVRSLCSIGCRVSAVADQARSRNVLGLSRYVRTALGDRRSKISRVLCHLRVARWQPPKIEVSVRCLPCEHVLPPRELAAAPARRGARDCLSPRSLRLSLHLRHLLVCLSYGHDQFGLRVYAAGQCCCNTFRAVGLSPAATPSGSDSRLRFRRGSG